MLFHMVELDGHLDGWVLPNNPSGLPRIKVLGPDGFTVELEPNLLRADLRDRGQHDTGMVGFLINEQNVPGLSGMLDKIEIRESESNVLIYRKFQENKHLNCKLFRFELQAMPTPQVESLFSKRFALYYGSAERQPFDTLFGIINNPASNSIYLSGRPSFQRYEQLLKEREYKTVTLVRNPYEELAERLLFVRYAMSPNSPPFLADHMYGLELLRELVQNINFEDSDSIRTAFGKIRDDQRQALGNPLVRALACSVDELPRSGHIEIALSKLARMDLVGLRSRFGDFKSILSEIVGEDILGEHELKSIEWVSKISEELREIKQVKALLSIDIDLYSMVEDAISDAIGEPVA